MLFIIPAFLLCLLFTNLQPRLLIYIFQDWSDNDLNLRQQLCRFNIFHYGSILSIYHILLLTNFNFVLFIGMSCIFFPQIYTNAFVNVRPDVTSHYYVKYLLSRFLIVVSQYLHSFICVVTPTISFPCSPITYSQASVSCLSPFKYHCIYISWV